MVKEYAAAVAGPIATWLAKQRPEVVLLFAIFTVITLGGYAAFKYGVPAHLQQIQQGYERIEEKHGEQIELIRDLVQERGRRGNPQFVAPHLEPLHVRE